ncbi:MAG: hypothetical protein V9G19_11370 [Tetrasphaera sp.]
MRQIIEIVILAALLLVLSVLPGYAQERGNATPTPTTTLAAAPAVAARRSMRFCSLMASMVKLTMPAPMTAPVVGGSTPHCYEDEELQMSICE